jgi:hypothetical protein
MIIERAGASLLGKRIKGVVYKAMDRSPHNMLMIVFEDDTYAEIYGRDFLLAKNLKDGGMQCAREYFGDDNVIWEMEIP